MNKPVILKISWKRNIKIPVLDDESVNIVKHMYNYPLHPPSALHSMRQNERGSI
jgi:hypothetical protein